MIDINTFHDSIKFTLEKPVNNCLSFLDFKLFLHHNSFRYHIYFKDLHSGSIFPYNSFVPLSMKRSVVMGEIHRAIRRSSDNSHILISLQLIFSRFLNNFYPIDFLKKCLFMYIRNNITHRREKIKYDDYNFIRIPFYNEYFYQRFQSILRDLDLHNHIKFFYKTSTLKNIFKSPKENIICHTDCAFCKISLHNNICFMKNVIYKISCKICNAYYIGQTARLLKTRIHEHFTKHDSAVYTHFSNLHANHNIFDVFDFDVLHANLPNQNKRLTVETLYINDQRSSLMNGCISTQLF